MIHSLTGTIAQLSDTHAVLDVQGVGYGIAVSHTGGLAIGDTATLYTHLAVRETALDLYGFASQTDKGLFELLLTIPKVGPKSALDIMRKADALLLQDCIMTEDPSRLQKLSGVGKKTCENIVTHLKDKITGTPSVDAAASATTSRLSSTQADAIDALVSLGFDAKEARERILAHTDKTLSVSDLVAKTLQSQ